MSPSLNSTSPRELWACVTMLCCVSTTPLGRPVVPELYMIRQGSLGVDVGLTVDRLARRDPGLELVALAADDDDLLHGGEPVADQLDRRQQLVADEQDAGAGVVDDVVELVTGEPPVDDRVRGADQADRLGRE